MSKRAYSDKDRAETLAILDSFKGNISGTSKRTGVPRSTITEWAAGKVTDGVTEIRQEKKEELADIFESLTRKALRQLDESIDRARFGEVSLSVCQWVDKMLLLRGQPTAISETRADSANRAWAEEQIQGLIAELKVDRTAAIQYAREHAPTVAQWLM